MERHPVPHLLDPPPRCSPAGQGLVHASDSAGPSIDGASPHGTSARNEGQPLRLGRRAWLASDFMARVQEIRQASDRVALADSRIAASLPARDSEPGRSAWEAACADFHEEFARFVALVGLDEKLIRRGEPSAIERAITFMEADPQCFRSGYMLANAAYALANAPLSDDDRARLRIIVIDQVERPRARMMRPTGRLAGWLRQSGQTVSMPACGSSRPNRRTWLNSQPRRPDGAAGVASRFASRTSERLFSSNDARRPGAPPNGTYPACLPQMESPPPGFETIKNPPWLKASRPLIVKAS